MIWVKKKLLPVFLCMAVLLTGMGSRAAGEIKPESRRVLVVMDSVAVPEQCPLAAKIRALLSHFNRLEVSFITPGQISGQKIPDVLLYCGTVRHPLPKAMINLARQTPEVIWLGENLPQAFLPPGETQELSGLVKVNYRGRSVRFLPETAFQLVLPGKEAEIIATGWDGRESLPFAWQELGWTYLPVAEAEVSFLILADTLLVKLGEETSQGHLAYLIVDGVSPATDPAKLAALNLVLEKNLVPYSIAVSPVEGEEKNIAGKPKLQKELQRAAATGVRIIQKGYRGGRQLTDGSYSIYEYWNENGNVPLAPEEEAAALALIGEGVRTLAAADLAPVAFMPPGGKMSEAGFAALAKIYSLGIVNRQEGGLACGIAVPYSYRISEGALLAYSVFNAENITGAGTLAAEMRTVQAWLAVRSTAFAVTFSVEGDPEDLQLLLDALQRDGFTLGDLAQRGFLRVRTEGVNITLEKGQPVMHTDPGRLPQPVSQTTGEAVRGWLWWLVGILLLVITALQYSLARIRARKKRMYEVGEKHER